MAVIAAIVAALLASSPPGPAGRGPALGEPSRVHLVLAPERFRDALRPYLEHRRTASPHLSRCDFVPLEQALAQSEGRDDPERLKRFLFGRWQSGELGSCLLVGDCDTLPMRSMALDRSAAPAANWAFYPTDLYYADLARADGSFDDWNANVEGFHARYWGEVHGETGKSGPINADRVDYRPEIALGRWPVSTPEACAVAVAKTVAFESQAFGEGPPTVGMFAVGGWVDVRARVRAAMERIGERYAVALFLHDTEGVPAPSHAAMKELLVRKPTFVFHTGHGQPWGYEGCLDLATFDGVEQGARLPICFSVGCSTAETMTQAPYQPYVDVDGVEHAGTNAGEVFTSPPPPPAAWQSGARNSSSIAEELLRRPQGGAVAAIGCVTGSQPCAVTLLEGFTAALAAPRPPETLGEAWRSAIVHYVDAERLMELVPTADWYPPSVFFQGMKFVLFGDPALRLR
jgi:hypothetical protein